MESEDLITGMTEQIFQTNGIIPSSIRFISKINKYKENKIILLLINNVNICVKKYNI